MGTLTYFLGGEAGLILGILSVLLSLASIIIIWINVVAITNQNKNAIRSERNERFKNAIEQLGNSKNAIVLGGIYTLHRIAKDDKSYRENIFNIFCAFVRDTTTTVDYQAKYKEKPSEPIQAILNILCVNKKDFKLYRTAESKLLVDFSSAYLSGADLWGANLTNANLSETNLTNAILMKANLTNAYLREVNLTNAKLYNANLTNAFLDFANLTNAYLWDANLTNAYLNFANLTNVDLEDSNLKGAYSSGFKYGSFEEQINSRIGKETDLSKIENGYDPENPPFEGKPIFGAYTKEEAEVMIKKYNDDMKK